MTSSERIIATVAGITIAFLSLIFLVSFGFQQIFAVGKQLGNMEEELRVMMENLTFHEIQLVERFDDMGEVLAETDEKIRSLTEKIESETLDSEIRLQNVKAQTDGVIEQLNSILDHAGNLTPEKVSLLQLALESADTEPLTAYVAAEISRVETSVDQVDRSTAHLKNNLTSQMKDLDRDLKTQLRALDSALTLLTTDTAALTAKGACLMAESCPSGWSRRARGGIIVRDREDVRDQCPFASDGRLGGRYSDTWSWCHFNICCR
jgi:flagellar capping protein FliD